MDQTGGADVDPNTTTIGDLPGDETLAGADTNVPTAVQQLGTESARTLDAFGCASSS
jgi:hypothetical protein